MRRGSVAASARTRPVKAGEHAVRAPLREPRIDGRARGQPRHGRSEPFAADERGEQRRGVANENARTEAVVVAEHAKVHAARARPRRFVTAPPRSVEVDGRRRHAQQLHARVHLQANAAPARRRQGGERLRRQRRELRRVERDRQREFEPREFVSEARRTDPSEERGELRAEAVEVRVTTRVHREVAACERVEPFVTEPRLHRAVVASEDLDEAGEVRVRVDVQPSRGAERRQGRTVSATPCDHRGQCRARPRLRFPQCCRETPLQRRELHDATPVKARGCLDACARCSSAVSSASDGMRSSRSSTVGLPPLSCCASACSFHTAGHTG